MNIKPVMDINKNLCAFVKQLCLEDIFQTGSLNYSLSQSLHNFLTLKSLKTKKSISNAHFSQNQIQLHSDFGEDMEHMNGFFSHIL